MGKKLFLLAAFFLLLQNLYALDDVISHAELGIDFKGEYTRALHFSPDMGVFGFVEFYNRFALKSGVAPGITGDASDIKFFFSGRFYPIKNHKPFEINLAYHTMSILQYDMSSHSIFPSLSYNGHWAGITLGVNFRFTSFFDEAAIFEPILAFSGHVNFINNEKICAGFKIANFNDYYMGNMASWSLGVNGTFIVHKQLALFSEFELLQSGIDGLTTRFYGFVCRGGIRILW